LGATGIKAARKYVGEIDPTTAFGEYRIYSYKSTFAYKPTPSAGFTIKTISSMSNKYAWLVVSYNFMFGPKRFLKLSNKF